MTQQWMPIESAPKNQLVMVYTPPQPSDWPDSVRIGFDYIDPEVADDYWYNHGEHYEHYCCVAKPENCTGPQERAPYTHWMPLPAAPGTPPASAQDDAKDERQAFEAWAKKKKMPLARIGEQYDDFWVDHAWNGWQARASVAAPAAGDALPDLNADLIEILGRPNFACIRIAQLLRLGGVEIAKKAEAEQATVIHYLLGFYLKHGSQWHEKANEDIERRRIAALSASQQQEG